MIFQATQKKKQIYFWNILNIYNNVTEPNIVFL